MPLEEIPLTTPLERAPRRLLIETDQGRVLFEYRTGTDRNLFIAYLPSGRKRDASGFPRTQTVRQAVAAAAGLRPLRAFAVEQGIIVSKTNHARQVLNLLPFIVGGAMAIVGLAWESLGFLRFLIMGIGVAAVVIGVDAAKKGNYSRSWVVRQGANDEITTAEQFQLPAPPQEVDVDDVKAEYGRLLSDVVYRIECPALFDPHEPTSKAFTLALLQWDNNDGMLSDEERRALAIRVRSTFDAARANAERIGMAHIPTASREKASTALKAARLAADESATDAERAAALDRAVAILDELALYYLPSGAQARKAITGHAPLQLPGRRA